MQISLNELIEEADTYNGQKAFMGIGVRPDGVPVDLLRVYLLGKVLSDYTILIADEFSSIRIAGESGLNDLDLNHALRKYFNAFNLFQKVWPVPTEIISASDLINSNHYKEVCSSLRSRIEDLMLERQISEIQTEWGADQEDRKRFAFNELSVIEFLRENQGITLKIGPHSEKKYDNIMAKLSPEMNFLYLHTAYALFQSDREPSPYSINDISMVPNKRILITDELDTVEEKLNLGTVEALRYFAVLGSLAGRAHGKECLTTEEILCLDGERLKDIAQSYVLDNVIAPLRRQEGISVYRKTPMRKIYDGTYKRVKVKFEGRTPNLKEVVRSELDSITNQLVCLIKERLSFGFDITKYNEGFLNLEEASIVKEFPSEIYAPLLGILYEGKAIGENRTPTSLDLDFMSVLQRRVLLGYDVAIAKLRMKKSVYDGKREEEVLKKAEEKGKDYGLNPIMMRKVFQFIMGKTKELQDIVISRYELDFSS